jgi:FAD/FMN-containing dehydrogenase/Fe-S oxidoreductase
MTNPSAIKDFLSDLSRRAAGEIRTDAVSRQLYSTDASIYQVMPYGVFLPQHAEDVQAAVELAHDRQIAILPRGAGSSLAGQAVNEALVIDLSRHLSQVLELNVEERWVKVQPGMVLDELNLFLKPHGLQFGPDPASSNRATMGGIVSNNSTGSHSIVYGMTADHVLSAEALLSDGTPVTFGALDGVQLTSKFGQQDLEGDIYREIWRISQEDAPAILAGTPRHWRRCGGYNLDRFIDGPTFQVPRDSRFNLAKLICGAEGTLAAMTSITLNLVPLPEMTGLGIVHFDDLNEALAAVPAILEVGPSAVELLDNMGLTMCRDIPEYARLLDTFLEGQPNCILITEFYGASSDELEAKVVELDRHLRGQGIPASVRPALDSQIQRNVWTVRKVGLGLLMSIKGDHKPIPFIEDAAVPVEYLSEYVKRIEAFCNDLGTDVGYYAHASAGCLHIRPLINTKIGSDIVKLPEITAFSVELLGEYGGAFSSEHGDGRARSWLNERFFGPDLYGLFQKVKQVFDPQQILNPGNIVESGPMTENLRYGTSYQVMPLNEHLDFSADQGFHRAVEMCNGAGICRKRTTGTMCPSFMVTQEEEHSTRGRANMLRAAIAGQLDKDALTSKRMYEVMDLCIECKACKAECPSSVDMAKIKFEFLAMYYEKNPVPLRARLFGDIAKVNRLGAGRMAGLANWSLGSKLFKKVLGSTLGISPERDLPRLSQQPFDKWFRSRTPAPEPAAGSREVLLFNDTFNTYNSPEIARAALAVLEAGGCTVHIPEPGCCGRPLISKGLFGQARAAARQTIDRLAPFARRGVPIVGLEPSCLLTLTDEYLALFPDDPDAQAVADQAILFDDFVVAEDVREALQPQLTPQGGQVLLHGHCHQKALVGTQSTIAALEMAGMQVEEVDSGCCGMAGSFGYEQEHYDVSIQMAERRLLPAVRTQPHSTTIVAPGVSCRAQIQHGAARGALHPAEVLAKSLVG